LRIADCGLRIADCRLRIANFPRVRKAVRVHRSAARVERVGHVVRDERADRAVVHRVDQPPQILVDLVGQLEERPGRHAIRRYRRGSQPRAVGETEQVVLRPDAAIEGGEVEPRAARGRVLGGSQQEHGKRDGKRNFTAGEAVSAPPIRQSSN
jgi:hypothetical protein